MLELQAIDIGIQFLGKNSYSVSVVANYSSMRPSLVCRADARKTFRRPCKSTNRNATQATYPPQVSNDIISSMLRSKLAGADNADLPFSPPTVPSTSLLLSAPAASSTGSPATPDQVNSTPVSTSSNDGPQTIPSVSASSNEIGPVSITTTSTASGFQTTSSFQHNGSSGGYTISKGAVLYHFYGKRPRRLPSEC